MSIITHASHRPGVPIRRQSSSRQRLSDSSRSSWTQKFLLYLICMAISVTIYSIFKVHGNNGHIRSRHMEHIQGGNGNTHAMKIFNLPKIEISAKEETDDGDGDDFGVDDDIDDANDENGGENVNVDKNVEDDDENNNSGKNADYNDNDIMAKDSNNENIDGGGKNIGKKEGIIFGNENDLDNSTKETVVIKTHNRNEKNEEGIAIKYIRGPTKRLIPHPRGWVEGEKMLKKYVTLTTQDQQKTGGLGYVDVPTLWEWGVHDKKYGIDTLDNKVEESISMGGEQKVQFPSPASMIITDAANKENKSDAFSYIKDDEDDIVISLKPSLGLHTSSADALFSMAEGYTAKEYHRFIETARRSGFEGDIVFSVSTSDKLGKTTAEYLESAAAEGGVVVYHVPWKCSKRSGEEASSALGGMALCSVDGLFGSKKYGEALQDIRTGRPVATARYELYWAWSQAYKPSSRIMLVDFRDTFFQEDPFRDMPKKSKNDIKEGAIHLYLENFEAVGLSRSTYNKGWITQAYGKAIMEEIGDPPVICSGSTAGDNVAINTYLRAMVVEYDKTQCKAKGCDQGFHNYLFRKNVLVNAQGINEIIMHEQGKGAVNNLSAMRIKTLKEWGVLKDNGKVYNWDGSLSPVVHQYDRDKELANIVRSLSQALFDKHKHKS
mmetsp:Transcript_22978/g.52621  ORF Transcript_22978/g.52621 Transcript_22978/m.52621 type:complete len:663 (-) Transcript_22978:424-2412(-)